MGCFLWSIAICVLLFDTGEANPSHHKDEVWQLIVSQLVPIWKNRTRTTELSTVSTTTSGSLSDSDSKTNHANLLALRSTNRPEDDIENESDTDVLQNGTTYTARDHFELALGWLIGLPIIGIIVLCCCCYCCIKCCCGSSEKQGNVIVMQSNQNQIQPQQQPQHIIIQQPVYMNPPPEQQYLQPPPYEMRQAQCPVNNPVWDVPAHYHNGGGVVHNPNFAPPAATAPPPPQYYPEKY